MSANLHEPWREREKTGERKAVVFWIVHSAPAVEVWSAQLRTCLLELLKGLDENLPLLYLDLVIQDTVIRIKRKIFIRSIYLKADGM